MKSTITPLSLILAFVVFSMTQAWSSTAGTAATVNTDATISWTDTVPQQPGDTTPKKKKKKDKKEHDTTNHPKPDTFRTLNP
ncbi:hypothetical protein [Chitinophaga deserti]|uniref:hypothetical protein n=1 Tax=Chitinophaga deserti TaxID=2164099 RepID=UPI000D6D3709|nr:hypothetical protein [Chitinophaga deserti]